MKLSQIGTNINTPRTLTVAKKDKTSISYQGECKKSPYRLRFNNRSVYLRTKKDAKKVRKFLLNVLKDGNE